MGNPDLAIVFNGGEVSLIVRGTYYKTRKEAIDIGLYRYGRYINEVMELADNPEELSFEIKSINIYEITKE